MTLSLVLVSIVVATLLGLIPGNRWRLPLLLAICTLAVFVLQPNLAVRGLDFWLPASTLALTVITWVLTAPADARSWKGNWQSVAIIAGMALALGLSRFIDLPLPLTASRPPQFLQILGVLGGVALAAYLLGRQEKPGKIQLTAAFALFILLFVFLKTPALTRMISAVLRDLNGQSTLLASALDVRWLGFSYIAFRLMHTLRDCQSGRLPAVSLAEYVVYVIFFPALSAGPIDRIERFITDLRRPHALAADDFGQAGRRLMLGLFKKFAVADSLALISLNGTNALQVHSAGWAWILLYAYAFQILFDFSGYTDIAIGLGRLLGIKLPENFNSPYLKPNLTQFWNNWHMTLTQWFRAYFFNPVTRTLRSGNKLLPIPWIIFITQLATMVLIGLWHGVTWNFVLWGLWHGLGLFIHNRWSEWTKARFAKFGTRLQAGLNIGGILLTFHFVALGWVFFALPEVSTSVRFFQALLPAV